MSATHRARRIPRRLALITASTAAIMVPLATMVVAPESASAATTATTDPVGTIETLVATVVAEVICLPHQLLAPSVPAGCPAL